MRVSDPIAMLDIASQAGERAVADVDLASLTRLADRLDRAALLAMAYTLGRHARLGGEARGADEICNALRVAPRHRRIVRRWLRVLAAEGLVAVEEGERYRQRRPVGADEVERARGELDAAGRGMAHGPGLTRFFQLSVAYLPELLRDEISLQALLFGDGDLDVAEDVYRRNVASRYTNAAAAAMVGAIAGAIAESAVDGSLRVLEIGAGIGGTTADVVTELDRRVLDGCRVEYAFTDVTRFFLASARDRFVGRPWLRFGLFDINADYARQGHRPGRLDVVLAANVLHNAHDVDRVLVGLRDLLAPGGWLVFIETGREHYQLMTSMQFLMAPPADDPDRDFTDFRKGTDRIFPAREEWLAAMSAAGFVSAGCVPGPGHALDRLGQDLFVAQRPY